MTLHRANHESAWREQLKRVWKADYNRALQTLADYNSERARGLLHTPEHHAHMIALQREVRGMRPWHGR